MQLNSLHMRIGAVAAGVLLVAFFLLSGGSLGGDRVVQLDFGMYPDLLEGSKVEIDGKVVGTLRRFGEATRTGFEVSKGSHTVRVVHPDVGCDPIEVNLEKPGQKARLMLDLEDVYDRDTRRSETRIAFLR